MINPFSFVSLFSKDLATVESELQAGLLRFWSAAGATLANSSITLQQPNQDALSLKRNFFSTLFLYSYLCSEIPSERRILYAAINQCLRGMVTGCDNLLDDEYKVTLETDLPHQAYRFRSVLDIMVSDRVLCSLLAEYCSTHNLSADLIIRGGNATLQALALSGRQEADEEGGVSEQRLSPEQILQHIHHYKTGILFQCTWAIPELIEPDMSPRMLKARQSLYQIGIGCQLLDDIVDLFVDMKEQRHNYAASVIQHRHPPSVHKHLKETLAKDLPQSAFYAAWPELYQQLRAEAMHPLEQGLSSLFLDRHQQIVKPAAGFIAQRIGVDPN